MAAVHHVLTAEQLAVVSAAAADHRARADRLRWAARCAEMEAVLDDLAAAVLPRPDITHLIGNTCEGIDCRYDKGFTPTDHDIFPHLHIDSMLVRAADGSLVLVEDAAVPGAIRVADLEEDHEGRHPDSLGWQVGEPFRTAPPAGFHAEDDEVWLDAAALRIRVFPLLAPLVDAPVSGGHTADARTAALDARLDDFAVGVRDGGGSEELWVIGFQHCGDDKCFSPEEATHPHLHPVTVLTRDEDGRVDTDSYVLSQLPDDLLADDGDWAIPDLYRSIPTDADGPLLDPDVDIWIDAAALCARADVLT